MAATNLLKNRKRFIKEVLDAEHGEEILKGEADGEVMVVDEYMAETSSTKGKKAKKYKMSLFPTTHRIVVYEAKDWILSKDRFAQVPYSEMESISFLTFIEEGKERRVYCATDFVAKEGSDYPSILFKIAIDDLFVYDCYRSLIASISKQSRVPIDDYTDYTAIKESGLLTNPATSKETEPSSQSTKQKKKTSK